MKIIVIELEGHAECLYSFCKIFEQHQPKITVLSNQAVFEELKNELAIEQNFFWHVKNNTQNNLAFLETHLNTINQQDVVLLNTAQKQVNQYPIHKFKPPIILRIHNVHTFLARWQHLSWPTDFYALWKDFSYVIRELFLQQEWKKVQKFLQHIHFFTFPNHTIEQYVLDHQLLPTSKVFPAIPLACHLPSFQVNNDNHNSNTSRHFVVLGTVDRRRKDYQFLLAVWKQLLPQINHSIKLTLLGKPKGPYGQKILQVFQLLAQKHPHFTFQSYQERVVQTEFNKVMQAADVLLAPILLETRYKIYQEQYGYSKISGSLSDVIRYAKPAIFPSAYPIPKEFEAVIDTYTTPEELLSLILNYIHNKEYLKQKQLLLHQQLLPYAPQNLQKAIVKNLKKDLIDKT